MCSIAKSTDVRTIKQHLLSVANLIHDDEDEEVTATLVHDSTYSSMTAIIGGKVLCINFMN